MGLERDLSDAWTYGNPDADQAPDERIDRIRTGILLEMEYQFTGKVAPEMGSPLYLELSKHIADSPKHLQALAHARQANIRLLLSAVHHLVLAGSDHRLAQYFPTAGGTRPPDADLVDAFEDFVSTHAAEVEQRLRDRGVQTNEVRRCGPLWAAFTVASRRAGRPLALIELGCSSGLNLVFDRYAYRYSDGRTAGDPSSPLTIDCRIVGEIAPPLAEEIPVASRIGVDHDPVDLWDDEAISWQRACIWGDHVERQRAFDAAVEIARREPPRVLRGDMVDTLPEAFAEAPSDAAVCVYHTAAVNYLRRRRREELATALVELSSERPILWVTGEGPGIVPGAPAPDGTLERVAVPLVLTGLKDGSAEHHLLGLAGAHGGWLEWWNDEQALPSGSGASA